MRGLSPHEKYYKFCPNCKTKLERKLIDGRKRFFCAKCDFIFWNNPKPVASILIEKRDKTLLLKRAEEPLKGYWCLPGGYINYDEDPEKAVIREVEEEAGINVVIDGLIGVYQIDNDPRGINIDVIFVGKSRGEVKLSDDFQEFAYFGYTNLPDKIAYKHREAINDYFKR